MRCVPYAVAEQIVVGVADAWGDSSSEPFVTGSALVNFPEVPEGRWVVGTCESAMSRLRWKFGGFICFSPRDLVHNDFDAPAVLLGEGHLAMPIEVVCVVMLHGVQAV
ncbi:hypothetical protein M514_28231, partial [Trichuris suis]